MENRLPYSAEIKSIMLMSFDGSHHLDIFPQMLELTIYESIFSPLIKAELTLNDEIGLFVNFPLTGEEFVRVSYKPTNSNSVRLMNLSFVINGVQNISPNDNSRGYTYVLSLVSRPAYENVKTLVSHAYSGLVSEAAKDLFQEYIVKPAELTNIARRGGGTGLTSNYFDDIFLFSDVEDTYDINTVVIPNLRPIDALQWLASRAISQDYERNYLYTFYQTISGFHFKTIQSHWESTGTKLQAYENPYYYVSNIELMDKKAYNRTLDPKKSITNLYFNERFSTLDKIAEGYFENSYFEINLFQNAYHSEDTVLDSSHNSLDYGDLNTREYQEAARVEESISGGNIEKRNRVKYAFNNMPEYDETYSQYQFRDKWGKALRSKVGFSNIDVNITVEGDTDIEAGKIIFCYIPEMHGFNKVEEDSLLSGYYIVTDVKHVFISGQKHTTVMKINKDSYNTDIDSIPFKYSVQGQG